MPATPAAAKPLFLAALRLPPADWPAFLADRCPGDPALRGLVEGLLAAHREAAARGGEGAPDPDPTASYRPADGAPAVGDAVGPYRLRERVGEGGMGEVWVADQEAPVRRRVAVKLIKPGMDSRQVLARFEAERQALALMDHPHIAKVLDAGLDAGRPYFVMELVKGVPITAYCDARRLTPKERLELFVPVCQAIQHAHQKGVIHRDIKPSNVLVALYDDRPVPKVIDFGVAKAAGAALTDKTVYTGLGGVVGTPEYMSPEQATLNNLDVDTRSDVYALGVLLYELLAGSPPFARRELEKKGLLEMLRVVREEDPPRPSAKLSTAAALPALSASRGTEPKRLAGLLRSELDWVVMRALEKDRARRYQTAAGFAADVRRYLAGEAVQAHPPTAGYRLRKFARRNRAAVGAGMVVLLAVVVGVGGLAASATLTARAYRSEAKHRQDAEAAAASERRMADETRERQRATAAVLARAQLDRGLARLNDGHADGLLDLADAGETADELPDLRDAAGRLWAAAHHLWAGRVALDLPEGIPAFSPDGRRVAVLAGSGMECPSALHVLDVVTGRPLFPPAAAPEGAGGIVFSPDGRLVVAHALGEGARAFEADTGRPAGEYRHERLGPLPRPKYRGRGVCFSPDGRLLATGGADRTVRVWDVATGRPRGEPLRHAGEVWAVAFSPDGALLAAGGQDATCGVWEVATGRPHGTPLRLADSSLGRVQFTPDGRRLLAVTGSVVEAWDVATGRQLWDDRQLMPQHAALSPDGRRLAVGAADRKVWVFDVETGRRAGEPFRLEARAQDVAWSPDGGRLAATTQGGLLRVWDVGAPGRAAAVVPGSGRVGWSPDGGLVAVQGPARVWRAGPPHPGRPVDLPLLPRRTINPFARRKLAVAADGRVARVGPDGVLHLTGGAGGHPDRSVADGVIALASSPDGRRLFVGTAGWQAEVRDAGTGEVLWSVGVTDRAYAAAWSPDGARLAVGTNAGVAAEYDAGTGERAGPALLHAGYVRAVAYSPDGAVLATVAGDEAASTVQLWARGVGPLVVRGGLPGGPFNSNVAAAEFGGGGRLLYARHPYVPGGGEVLRVPPPPADAREARLRTWVTLGARRGPDGRLEAIPPGELAGHRDELAALDRGRPPVPWGELETGFVTSLRDQAERSKALWAEDDLGRALAELRRLSDRGAGVDRLRMAMFYLMLGEDFGRAGRPAEEDACYQEAVRLDGDSPEVRNRVGIALGRKGRLDAAAAAFQEAIRLRPNFPEAHKNLGVTLGLMSRWEAAATSYREAVRLKPDDPDTHNNLGHVLGELKCWDEAAAAFREAVRLKPDYALAHKNLAWLLAMGPDPRLRDPAGAVGHARRATELVPSEGAFWYMLGAAHYRAGDWPAAVAALDKSMGLEKGGGAYQWFVLAMAKWQLGDRPDARRWHAKAAARADVFGREDDELRWLRAEAAELLGVLAPPPRPKPST